MLRQRGAEISFSDPHVTEVAEHGLDLRAISPDEALNGRLDLAIVTTHHSAFDYRDIVARAPLVLDTRNALRGVDAPHIFRL
jgi:UDP-N-acetyl-D-glucosamine dehydrogenase